MKLFADDTKVLKKKTCLDDQIKLQNAFDAMNEQTNKWLLKFNGCKLMYIVKNNRHNTY